MQSDPVVGRVFQINVSPGGVPKHGQIEAEVTELGLVGDDQHHKIVHGGPDRALCLYSLEKIMSLQAEKHPIFPGAMGENLTLAGLDWDSLAPGMRLRIGDQVLVEITRYTTPCQLITPYFLGEDSDRVSQKLYPGWSRLYARVLVTGRLRVGDEVKVLT